MVDAVGLPGALKADIPKAKIVDYLLSQTHPSGRTKAAFFTKHGFTADKWQELADALRQQASAGEVMAKERTLHGIRYVVDGLLVANDGASLNVRSVWFIRKGDSLPSFATAHPLRRKP